MGKLGLNLYVSSNDRGFLLQKKILVIDVSGLVEFRIQYNLDIGIWVND